MGPEHRWADKQQEDPGDAQFRQGQRQGGGWSSHGTVTSLYSSTG